MRIGIDLKPFFSSSKFRGIGMYSRNLVEAMMKENRDSDIEFHFLNMYGEYDNDPIIDKRCYLHEYFTGPKVIDVGERQLFKDKRLESLIETQVRNYIETSNIDIMLFTSPVEYGNLFKKEWFKDVLKVGILYDVIPYIFPEQCLGDDRIKEDYSEAIEFMKEMDLLLAISECSKNDAVKHLGIPPEKIVVIYSGIDSSYKKLEKVNMKEIKQKYGIKGPFILFAGGIDFKKNIEYIIRAYSRLGNDKVNRYQLVITGNAPEDVLNLFKHMAYLNGVSDRVICTGFIPQEDLVALYNITDLFVFPSIYEGFGLPIIEAMACGARVLTSNNSSLGEIAKDYATLVNPKSEKSILKGMKYIINHPIETSDKLDEARQYALTYTWDKVASKTWEAIYKTIKNINIEKEINAENKFSVNKELLYNIADIYLENNIMLSDEEIIKIVKTLSNMELNVSESVINGKNRIFFDMTVVSEWIKAKYSTGIGRVCVQLLKEMSKTETVIPIIIQSVNNEFVIKVISKENFKVMDSNISLEKDDIFFMPELQIRGVQVLHEHPYANMLREKGVKCYGVLYDILPLQFPQYFESKTANSFDKYVRELVSNYDGILCDSKSVADDLMEYCHKNQIVSSKSQPVKIGYFHLGSNSFNKIMQGDVPHSVKVFFENGSNVFLMVGTIEPRKGHQKVLEAFEKAWQQGEECKLCIIGHMGWNMQHFVDKIKNHKLIGDKLAFFEGVSDATLEYAYTHATALIQASAGEGFGLPLIEAGQYGLPIMCSDIPVFHEVAGENALYFEAMDRDSIFECIREINESDIEELPCSKNIEITSWEKSSQKVINMIKNDSQWYGCIEAKK